MHATEITQALAIKFDSNSVFLMQLRHCVVTAWICSYARDFYQLFSSLRRTGMVFLTCNFPLAENHSFWIKHKRIMLIFRLCFIKKLAPLLFHHNLLWQLQIARKFPEVHRCCLLWIWNKCLWFIDYSLLISLQWNDWKYSCEQAQNKIYFNDVHQFTW